MAYDRSLPVSATNPAPAQNIGGSALATGQISVASTATLIAAARPGRSEITIINHGTSGAFLGDASVTTGSGALLAGTAGATVVIKTSAAVYGIVASGTQTVSFSEVY